MIPANDIYKAPADVWERLAAPFDPARISWRQDGKPINRDGKFLARFVAYIEANDVRERLDSIVPGEWDSTLMPLPSMGSGEEHYIAFKCRLQVLGVVREDVGQGTDYKQAATDAFKRAAVRFGIAHELYSFGQNWVELDGDGKYAKPKEDPAVVYARKHGSGGAVAAASGPSGEARTSPSPSPSAESGSERCPKCGSKMWDNRLTKRNPRAPDFKCRDRSCDGVIWPAKPGEKYGEAGTSSENFDDFPPPHDADLPF